MKGKGKVFKLGIILAIIIVIAGIFVLVNADNTKVYVVDVLNSKDTEENAESKEEIKIHKKIEKDNSEQPYYDDKNITYSVSVTNINKIMNPEVALVLDTSYSIEINDQESQLKTNAINLVKGIFADCASSKIQLFNAAGLKTNKLAYSGYNQNAIINTINALSMGDGNDIRVGLEAAKTSFTADESVEKYIIIFTDATDYTKELLQEIDSNDIKIILVSLDNIISNSYTDTKTLTKMVYSTNYADSDKLYEEFNVKDITNLINCSFDAKVTDKFSEPLKQYFDFELISTNYQDNIQMTEDGYVWNIEGLKRGETIKLVYKLNIKNGISIEDTSYKYHPLTVSDKLTVEYSRFDYTAKDIVGNTLEVKEENIPIIQICEKYSVTLKAVSEENVNLAIEGISFKVIAKDKDGNVVYNDTLTTNSKGEVIIDNLKSSGTVHFEVTPSININGYDKTDTVELEISNQNGVGFVMETVEFKDKFLSEEDKRNCTVTIPINTKKFTLEINLSELNNTNSVIGNTEFRLIQPKLNNKYEMAVKYAETDSSGKAIFTPTIMTKAGTYEYILSQMTVQDGYISMGNVTIRIKFDNNGYITDLTTAYNDSVTGERINGSYGLIKIQNGTEKEDMFNLELNLTDAKDNKIKLDGAEYDIEVKRVSGGQQVTNTYYNCQTNEKGKLLIDLPGSGNIQLRIKQVKASTGYYIDTEAKIITIRRQDGTVQEVAQAYNEDTYTTVDARAYSSENKLIVNLTNDIRYERNIINVRLSDYEENDVIISNIEVEITNLVTGQKYRAITGMDGVAKFQIDGQEQGEHQYQVKILSNLPNIYSSMPNSNYNIRFGDKENMEMVSDLWDDANEEENPLISIEPVQAIENGEFIDYTATINLGAIISDERTYWFELELTDSDDTNVKLEGASYNITITYGDMVREIKGRKTDVDGKIKTRLIPNKEIMTIEVTQVESISKYKMDITTKEIDLKYSESSGKLSFIDQSIKNTTIDENIVLFKHTNIKKTGDDVLLDLTINKEDINGLIASGVPVRIRQESQGEDGIYYINTTKGFVGADGNLYGSWIETSGGYMQEDGTWQTSTTPIPLESTGEDGLNVIAKTDNQGTIVLKGLKVNGCPVPGDGEFILYVTEVDANTLQDKPGTTIKYKITYRYNVNKEIVEITNVETTLGNRLVKEKIFNGYEAALGYQSNIITTTYTNYDDVGNLEIDLNKYDNNGNVLVGAEYLLKVLRPDGSTLSNVVKIEDGTIEIPGIIATVGTQIELTETVAPIGYELNELTEVYEITQIDETGEIYLQYQSQDNYEVQRSKLEKKGVYTTTSATLKTQYAISFIDYEIDIFNIKITAIDSTQKTNISGYSFKINTSKGAQAITSATGADGIVETLVGGKYENEIVTYTISKAQTAQYYKDITPFTLSVQFDANQRVDATTLNIQTDSNYGELDNGKTWKISGINVSDDGAIELEVYIEQEDPLEVEIETIDAISGNKVTNATYKIEPSEGYYSGNGKLDQTTQNTIVEVGYVQKNASKQYILKTTVTDNYEKLADQLLTIYYDKNGDISQTIAPSTTSNTMTITSYNGKKITLRNVIEPKQGIQIVNKDYFTGETITEAEFKITEEDGETKTVSMGLTGIGSTLGSKNGDANTTVKYKVHQSAVAVGYATIPDFEIEVTYGNNREITNVALTSKDCEIWVNPTFIIPSTKSDLGYNGNDKGIVKLEINSYYDFRVNIENVERLDKQIKISGTKYEVTSTEKKNNNASGTAETNVNGVGTAHLDDLKLSKKVIYTIKEVAPAIDYQPLEISSINVEVEFDSDGFVIPNSVKVITGYGEQYATAAGITPVVNDTDKFTINLQITSLPKFRMNIKNIDYFDNTVNLSGTKYTIKSSVGNSIDDDKATDSNGEVTLRVDGNPRNKVTYTLHEVTPSSGYQSLEQDIIIDVIFNEDGTVNKCEITQGNRFSSAVVTNIVTTFDKLSIDVEIKSVELLKFELNNIYEHIDTNGSVNNIALSGTKYKISAIEVSENENLNVDTLGVTNVNGMTTIGMDRALSNKTIKYIITEEESSAGYKSLDCEIIIQVTFDYDGKIKDSTWSIIPNQDGNSSNNFATITNVDIDNFTISVQIKSNKLLDFEINNISTIVDEDTGAVVSVNPVIGTTYKISATEVSTNTNLEVDKTGATDANGNTTIGMDRALANKTIHYTITEEIKTVGYNWIDSEIIIEISFNAQGRIIDNSTKIIPNSENISANVFTTITNVDINNYKISLTIENTPIKEFGIHLVARDMYSEAPIDGVKANAYLADNSSVALISDKKYDFSVVNKDMQVSNEDYKYLYTGVDRDGDGKKDIADGEDYLSMGEYMEGDNTDRTLRVILRDVPDPYQWYANNTGTKQEFQIVIKLKFDDEGRIIQTNLVTGYNEYIGWQADERFVSVVSTGYGLTIRLNFYPMLYVKMEAQDMYTGEILESSLNLSTSSYPIGGSNSEYQKNRIQEGYVGYTYSYSYYGNVYEVRNSHNYERTATAENNRERTFYIYELSEPKRSEEYYNKYRKYEYPPYTYYRDQLIGTIKVIYDEHGKIQDAQVTSYNSSNNIQGSYIDLSWTDYYLDVKVKYVPTTKIVAQIVDRVTGVELNNIEIYPFKEGHKRYKYYVSDYGYETTSSKGIASWTYWGANIQGTTSTYVMKTRFNGNEYNGYYLPGDVKIDVAYGDTGRISGVQVLSQNQFGDALNAEATWQDTTVYLTIKLDRKFNLQIDKKNIFDLTENLNVKFDIESNKHETASLNAWNTTTVGRVHAGETVEYTLSESSTIYGYVPLNNIKLYVEFNTDGTVERAYVDKDKEKYFEVHSKASAETGKKGINTTDLEIIIKNTPTLLIDTVLKDAFYDFKLKDAVFTIENSKGETASGSLVTNANGIFTTGIGEVYPNEEITYTMKQVNIVNGYRENTAIMEFKVKYNENGYIESYTVTQGNEVFTIEPQIYNGGRYLKLNVINDPKYVNIGITKKDAITGDGINDVEFKVDVTDVLTNNTTSKTYITQTHSQVDGTVSGEVDEVEKSNVTRAVRYKISEIKIPDTYRKIHDVEIEVIYNEDGSILTYDVLQNDNGSNVDIKVHRKGSDISTLNGILTHIELVILNDNRYDLIIKNEDINYPGLAIKGTTYDVSIDGVVQNIQSTDDNGKTGLYNLTGSGEITIRIAEKEIGNGYRENNQNDTIIVLEKGETVYSLNLLSNSNNANATVVVDSDKGTVTVTFKNETKSELLLIKYAEEKLINGKGETYYRSELKSDIVFEITSQEVDNYGNGVGDITTLTTVGINDTTNDNGQLYFDLGVTPQNKIIEYTIKEITELEGYLPLEEVKIRVVYNMYGQISSIIEESPETEVAKMEDNNHGIIAVISNILIKKKCDCGGNCGGNCECGADCDCGEKITTVYPTYTIKVATEDSVTNKRINGGVFDFNIAKDDKTEISNIQGGITSNRTTDSGLLLEKGVISVGGITTEGNIIIDIDQREAPVGYEFSDKTSGTIKLNVEYTVPSTPNTSNILLADINISLIEDDGFTVVVDNKNREIIVTLKNKPGVTLHIDKYYETVEKDEEGKDRIVEKPIYGAKFTITSEIQTSNEIITTDLNRETKSTDENGQTSTTIGIPYAGKTILYTIKEAGLEGFEQIDDIIVLVKYDSSGNIKYMEVLSNEDITEIKEAGKGESFGVGTKEFAIKVKNTQTANDANYKIILEKHSINDGQYDYLIPNTEYEITVKEEYGTERTWRDITNEEGIITSPMFYGYGRIQVIYTEITAAEGYEKDDTTYKIEFSRDKVTGKLTPISSDENYEFDDENKEIVYVKPQDDLQNERYDLIINKIDASNNNRIINNQAAFKVSMFETQQLIEADVDSEGNIIEKTEEKVIESQLGIIATDSEGKAKLTTLQMPTEPGTYKLKISEIKAPEGYIAIEDGVYLNVTFEKNENETMEITTIENLSSNEIDILKTDKQLIGINIKNQRKEIELKENEFAFDITKVDSDTKEAIINNEAIFRLTDEQGNKQYIETNIEDGKLLMPILEMPEDSEFVSKNKETTIEEELAITVEKTYELQEIMAPEGYLISTEPIIMKVKFAKDAENNTIIKSIEITQGENTIEASEDDRIITFNIENTEGQLINDADRGRYTINLSKIDGDTGLAITEHATFEITLENGEKVTASTDDDGNMQIKDIKVPATVVQNLGPYSYVIQETKAADGYELIDGFTIMELTFKELLDPETGEKTGLYGIDDINNVPVITVSDSAIITSYTEEEVNITISNKLADVIVKYDANCDDETVIVPENQVKKLGQDLILDTMVPEREGYNFKGWATKADAIEAEYQPGDIYTDHETVTLYAVWEEILYLKSTEYLIGTGENPKELWSPGQETQYEDGDLYIKGIRPRAGIRLYANQVPSNEGTYLEELLSNLNTNADEIKVYIPEYDSDGNTVLKEENIVGNNTLIGTAMVIKLTKGEQEIQLTLIVRGDLITKGNTVGDGKVTNVEAKRLKTLNNYTLTKEYTIEEQQALDYYINTDNRWSTNKQAIIRAYQEHTLETIR